MTATPAPDLWAEPTPADDTAAADTAAAEQVQAAAEDGQAEQHRPENADRLLPAAVTGLDLDAMRTAAPIVRDRLVELLRESARMIREARGTVVVEEDTYELVRRLTAAQEVMTQWAQAFIGAAQECRALVEEEALSVPGAEDGGTLTAGLYVPDGEGQRIAVRPDYKAGSSTWDVDTLVAWLAEQTVADEGRKPTEDGAPVWSNEEAVSLVRDGIDRLRGLGSFTPGAKPIEALRKKLAGLGRDADAAVLRQVRTVGPRTYLGVKVTREETQ
jgi:hypothetical protein